MHCAQARVPSGSLFPLPSRARTHHATPSLARYLKQSFKEGAGVAPAAPSTCSTIGLAAHAALNFRLYHNVKVSAKPVALLAYVAWLPGALWLSALLLALSVSPLTHGLRSHTHCTGTGRAQGTFTTQPLSQAFHTLVWAPKFLPLPLQPQCELQHARLHRTAVAPG